MTSETRVLRPFDQVEPLDDFFADITLLVGDEVVEVDGRITLDEEVYRHVPVAVKLPHAGRGLADAMASIEEGLTGVGLTGDNVQFVVHLYSSFLKISDYVYQCPISRLAPDSGIIRLTGEGARPTALRAAHSGCRIEVAAVLANELPPQTGRPWRRGTWLARSRFAVSCDVDFAGFTARPMDLEQKAALFLPPGTTRFVSLPHGIDPVADEVPPDVIELWVDAELLANMSARPKSPVSTALQCQLFCDVFAVTTAVARTRPGFNDVTWKDLSPALLGKLIAGLAGRERTDDNKKRDERCVRLLNLLKEDHGRFMAYVEELAGTTVAFTKALGD